MANFLHPQKVTIIMARLGAGDSLRLVARTAGVSKNTVARYMPRDVVRLCPCGADAGHKGWCKHRYALSPARQAFHASRPRRLIVLKPKIERQDLVYPFIVKHRAGEGYDLMQRVNSAVPRHYDPSIRADICQEIIAGVLGGDYAEENLAAVVKQVVRQMFQLHPTKYGPLSLDAPIPGAGNLRLIDTLTEDDSIWSRAA